MIGLIPSIILGGDPSQDDTVKINSLPGLIEDWNDQGADGLLITDSSSGDEAHEAVIGELRKICRQSEFPVYGAGRVRRLEDVKKLLYAGCSMAVLQAEEEGFPELLEEASSRFGRDRLMVMLSGDRFSDESLSGIRKMACGLILTGELSSEKLSRLIEDLQHTGSSGELPLSLLISASLACEKQTLELLRQSRGNGWICPDFSRQDFPLREKREELLQAGYDMARVIPTVGWQDLKTGADGLVPVVVQDFRTDEVLMVAYMNEEAFETTLRTGRMTYFSRSRQELWIKGLTSGHFQYVKSLCVDCDRDTILAKVKQIGAACHTGNRSCFYTTLMEKPVSDTNPLKVFQSVYDVILDRKVHPREGSYTNYLFDKGIDKILKKVGEECTEIVIAAKNPDQEEIKYEISDFLYHVMVLMAEKGVTWEDVTTELANR